MMIRLKSLLNPTIYLCEANSGYSDHKSHSEIGNKIFEGWLSLLKGINRKSIPLKNLDDNEVNVAINSGHQFSINLHDELTNAEIIIKVDVLLAIKDCGKVLIQGAASVVEKNPIEVYLLVHKESTIDELLSQIDYIRDVAFHEATHIIKHHQKIFQLSMKRDEDLTKKDKEWWYKYYTSKSELHSNIAQLNNELKHIKMKNNGISFSSALNISKLWKRYQRNIFGKNPKIRSKMLSKLANYWSKL